jgi:hypothetical protein
MLRREVDKLRSGNTKVGKAKDSEKLGGSTKRQIIEEAQQDADFTHIDDVERITFKNVTVLGDSANGRQVFSGNTLYMATDN